LHVAGDARSTRRQLPALATIAIIVSCHPEVRRRIFTRMGKRPATASRSFGVLRMTERDDV
jgi:hypothetical protein